MEQQDFCSALAEALRLGNEGDVNLNGVHSPTSVSEFSPANSSISSQASSRKYIDVDGIVAEHSSISDSTQFPLPAQCLHVSSSRTLTTMRAPVPDVATSLDLPSLSSPGNSSSFPAKPHSDPSRALAIPPSPRVPPPNPPNSPPPYGLDSVDNCLGMGFPSPPTLSRYSSSASPPSEAETQMERRIRGIPPLPFTRPLPHPPPSFEISSLPRQNYPGSGAEITSPPALPPRSRLRPPPVKITTNFSQIRQTIREDSEERDELPLERSSLAHSRSASITSLTISPLSTPPLHSRSSSAGSYKGCCMPTPLHHSHSSSVASSLIISPMPTPPPLSPSSPLSSSEPVFPPLPLPHVRPATPELDMRALRALILRRAGRTASRCGSEREVGESLEAIALAHKRGDSDAYDASSTCTVMTPEFAWQEEPRAPPSRLSFYESAEPIHPSSDPGEDEQDDAASIYSQFSSTYTFRSRTKGTTRMRSLRRNGSTGRAGRRMAATSMMSVYSQASFSSQDAMDMPPMPSLPWGLRGDLIGEAEGPIAEHDLGEMTCGDAEYAYAYSLDDYVGHGLEGAALAGRTAARSRADFEAELPSTPRRNPELSDDWRAFLTAQDSCKVKRRTSSNISVVGNVSSPDIDPEVTPGFAFTDMGWVATNGSIGDISTTSTLTPMSPVTTGNSPATLVPNRRQRTIRRVAMTSPPSSPRSYYEPPSSTSVNFVFDTETSNRGWRREVSFPSIGPELYLAPEAKKTRGMRSGLQGMRSRVSVLKSRLVSLTLAPRSPSSPSFASGRSAELKHPGLNPHLSPISPSATAHSPTSVSPSVSSSSSGGSSSSTPSSGSSWTPGLTTGAGLFLSPIAAPSPAPMAI